MKLSTKLLRKLIREEMQMVGAGGPGGECDAEELLNRLEELLIRWQPQTDEGMQYYKDLEEVVRYFMGEPYTGPDPKKHTYELSPDRMITAPDKGRLEKKEE
jgi:hypothetical protein